MTNVGKMRQSTFFIPNLHCPSCTAQIEEALKHLEPRPTSISSSIISHTVTVQHPSNLDVSSISRCLDEAGFEVFDVVDEISSSPVSKAFWKQDDEERGIPSFAFEQAIARWRRQKADSDDEKQRIHVGNCDLCRSEKPSTQRSSQETDADLPPKLVKATLAIGKMTCSSCVGSIMTALEAQPWVQSANVTLLTHSASVLLHGEQHAKELPELIEHIGFEATLQHVEDVDSSRAAMTIKSADMWQATYAVGGMTCSACIGAITAPLENYSWVKRVDVSLLSNNAVVVFEGKDHVDEIREAIEDIGYEATLDSVVDLHADITRDSRRQVSINVAGIYCEHCPPRIEQALQALGQVTIEKLPSVSDSIVKVSYIPNAPDLTIRTVINAIKDADRSFEPTVYHPMSLEERSRRMQVREQHHMLYRVILSVLAAIPALIIGIVYMDIVPGSNPTRQYLMEPVTGVSRAIWATFVDATVVYFFAADVFHRRTFKELHALWRPGSPVPIVRRFYRFGSMNMLISFGTSIAYFASVAEMAVIATSTAVSITSNPTYFDSVVFLTMFLLIGRLIEAYSKAKAGDAVAELGKLRPTTALLVSNDPNGSTTAKMSSPLQIKIDLLEIGDVVKVLHGASPPFDGVVLEGESKFDESSLTGESKLVTKSRGDEVFSGTINKHSPISVRLTSISGDSMLDQIMKVVREGQARRAPVERVADILTGYFVPVVTLTAVTTWIVWLSLGLSGTLPPIWLDIQQGGWPFWSLQFAIAVFVIACPCGIGLAAPTALFVGGGLAARHGILVKGGGEAFQEASRLDCIVFDKTGTLTHGGEPKITDYTFVDEAEEGTLLGITRALESESSHPIAKALVAFCESRNAQGVRMDCIGEIPGKGITGRIQTATSKITEAIIGNESLLTEFNITLPSNLATETNTWKDQAKSIALLAVKTNVHEEWCVAAAFSISDPIRPEAPSVIKALQIRSIAVWMISGDNPQTAHAVGAQVGIPESNIIAGVLPSRKAEQIKRLQGFLPNFTGSSSQVPFSTGLQSQQCRTRATVAMIGDGINDSPALTTADVGIAIGSGSDVAISSAKFVLVSSSLFSILTLVDLSAAVFRRIKFNFAWALVYNLVALPIAAGVLYPVQSSSGAHIRLDPVWAALAMALSSISVVTSSLLLRTRLPVVGFRA